MDIKKKHTIYTIAIGAHYSNKKQMRFHRHPVKDTWIYFKVEEVGQKSVHNYMNALCPQGNSKKEGRVIFFIKTYSRFLF